MGKIVIAEEDRQELSEFYQQKITKTKQDLSRLENTLSQLNGKQNDQNRKPAARKKPGPKPKSSKPSVTTNKQPSNNGYPIASKWEDRILYVLKKIRKVCRVSDVYEVMVQYEPTLKNDETASKKSISAVISALGNPESNGPLVKTWIESKVHYGLRDWFNPGGSIKIDYKPIARV